ncbi:hypothetical protein Scep_007258 [Stephania cephalantha]|uniref:Uncharacterized protein n=1 Tax=Stephania cephalantha TaxID=152367 RepID=A0AAP0K9N5_9MAGN
MYGYTDNKGGGAHGPLSASAYIWVFARFDYQLDVGKDYKETGYYVFENACKFMHDRGDCKSRWQLDMKWEDRENERMRDSTLAANVDDDDDDEDSNANDSLHLSASSVDDLSSIQLMRVLERSTKDSIHESYTRESRPKCTIRIPILV